MRAVQLSGVGGALALAFAAGAQPEALLGLSSRQPARVRDGRETPAQRLLLAIANRSFELPSAGAPGTIVPFASVPGWEATPETLQAGIRLVPIAEYNPGELLSPQAAYAQSGLDINFILVPGAFISDLRPSLLIESGREYELSVRAGRRIGNAFGGARLSILGGSSLIGNLSDAIGPVPGAFGDLTLTLPPLLPGNPVVGQPIRVELANLTPSLVTEFDDVELAINSSIPEPALPPDSDAQLDTGVIGNSIGLIEGGATLWMQRYPTPPEGWWVGSVSMRFDRTAMLFDSVQRIDVFVWGDDDGIPGAGSVLLGSATADFTPDDFFADAFQTVAFDEPVWAGGYPFYFIGAATEHVSGAYPAALDMSVAFGNTTWVAGASSLNTLNPADLVSGQNILSPTRVLDAVGVNGVWLLRAESGEPCEPQDVHEVPMPRPPVDIAVVDNLAYTSSTQSISIFDVTDPLSPVLLGGHPSPFGFGLTVRGDLAFSPRASLILDVSDPSGPEVVYQGGSFVGNDIDVRGDIACLTSLTRFTVVDISDPHGPIVVAEVNESGFNFGVDIEGALAFVAVGNGLPSGRLRVRDISNPASPVLLADWAIPGANGAVEIKVVGSLAFVAASADHAPNLAIIDVTNPAAPMLRAMLPVASVGESIYDLRVLGNAVFMVTSEGTVVVDASNPSAPFVVGTVPGLAKSIAFANGLMLTGESIWFQDDGVLQFADPGCIGELVVDDDFSPAEDTDGDRFYSTIQAAIDDAVDSSVITVNPGTYAGGLNTLGKAITIRSTNPLDSDIVQQTIIRQTGGTGLRMNSAETHSTVIDGLTFQQCSRGIQIEAGSGPWIRHCLFLSNDSRPQGVSGAGISIIDAEGTRIESCFFQSNRAPNFGAGVSIVRGSAQIISTVFRGNSAPRGAALCVSDVTGSAEVINCTITGNTLGTGSNGGETPSALHIRTGASAEVHNTIVWSNGTLTDVADSSTGTITGSHNIIGTSTAGPSLSFISVDPELGGEPLGLGPLPGSPAIDAGNTGAYPHDVRGRGNVPRYRDDPQTPDTGLIDPTIPGRGIIDIGIGEFQPVPFVCAPDLSGSSDPNDPAYGVPDGLVDSSDFFYFLDQFSASNVAVADLTGSADPNDPSYGTPDGFVDASDFFYYLDLFVAGCP